MKRATAVKTALAASILALSASVYAGGPSAEMLANTCAGCHGTNGVSVGPATPSIAGISQAYFNDAMKAYKEGTRPSTIMTRIAKGYTEEEITAMAGFFAKQKFVASTQQHDSAKAADGKKLHDKFCEKCHANGGSSSEDDAGILYGQWAPYLKFTFEDFHSGKREMEKKMAKKMEELKEKEGDAGMDKLVNYYSSAK